MGCALYEEETDAIARYCKQLRKVAMFHPEHDLETFFSSIRRTLEELKVYGGMFSPDFLRFVKDNFRLMHTLRFIGLNRTFSEDSIELVLSYSTQLQTLALGHAHLTRAQFEAISRECPRADCSVSCSWDELKNVMIGVGDLLVGLYVYLEDAGDVRVLRDAASNYTRLAEIHWFVEEEPAVNESACMQTVLEEV